MESDSDTEPQESPQKPKFPHARTGNEPGLYGGFGFDGPSQAWLKANGFMQPHFEGGSGRLDEETPNVNIHEIPNPNLESDKARRDEERRQKMLARFQSGNPSPPPPQVIKQPAAPPKKPELSHEEIVRRQHLAEKRELGLVMSKFALEEKKSDSLPEEPKQRIISPEEERKRELLTQWLDYRTNEEPINVKRNATEIYLEKLFDTENLSDLNVVVDSGERIKVHKSILGARSPIFNAMLTSSMLEASLNEVQINGYSYEAVKSMLLYLYTGKLKTDNQHIMELLYLAGLYRVNGLKLVIQIELEKCIDEDNLEAIWDAAMENEAIELKEKCVEFCFKHQEDIRKIFAQLPKELKAEVIRRKKGSAI